MPGLCHECGYSLRGLRSDRCPECGSVIDRSPAARRREVRMEGLASCVCVLFVVFFMPAVGRTGPPWRRPPIIAEVLPWLPLIAFLAVAAGYSLQAFRRGGRVNTLLAALGLFVAAALGLMMVRYWQTMT